MGRRFIARVIDVAIFSPLILVSTSLDDDDRVREALATVGVVLIWGLYEALGTARFGTTFGKWAAGLRVVRFVDGHRPSLRDAVSRWGAFIGLVMVIPCVGWILVPLSPMHDKTGWRRGWHDRIAGTLIVSRRGS